MRIKELPTCIDESTAYVINGYAGNRSIRYWIETRANMGQRLVTQTTTAPKPGEKPTWMTPKKGAYTQIANLYVDEDNGFVHSDTLGAGGEYPDEAKIARFAAKFPLACADERNAKMFVLLRRYNALMAESAELTGKTKQVRA